MATTNVVIINRLKSNGGSSFLIAIAVLAVAAMTLGYMVYGRGGSKGEHRHRRGMIAQMGKSVMSYDVNPAQLKARIVQILVNNTMDLNSLNNVMNHVLNRIDSDMQQGGILQGLVSERSLGKIDRQHFADKLSEYVKSIAVSMSIPLMDRDSGTGSFVRRYVEGGGGSGGMGGGYPQLNLSPAQLIRRGNNTLAYPASRITADDQVEWIDNSLRRL